MGYRCTDLTQSELEQAKMAHNRDVGSAVLEAYSRVLESRVSMLRDSSLDVLQVAGHAPNGLKGVLSAGADTFSSTSFSSLKTSRSASA